MDKTDLRLPNTGCLERLEMVASAGLGPPGPHEAPGGVMPSLRRSASYARARRSASVGS